MIFAKPVIVTDSDVVFGHNDVEELLPKWEDIPKEFHSDNDAYVKVINRWFYEGLPSVLEALTVKSNVNEYDALRHIASIMASFEQKHERKIYGCAYLVSLFFEVNKPDV